MSERDQGFYWIKTDREGPTVAKWYSWGSWAFIGNDQTFKEEDLRGLRVIAGPLSPPNR